MEDENQSTVESQPESSENSASSGNKNGLIITLVVIAVIALAGGIYFLSKKTPGSLNTTDNGSVPTTAPLSTSDQPVKEVTILAKEFSFTPGTITVNKGDRIKLIFKNEGKMQHDFVIDEFGVATKVISAGEEDTIEFTPTDSGTFEFYCSVGNHRAQGMVGTLEVK